MEISVVFPGDAHSESEKDSCGIRPYSAYNTTTERSREVCAIVAAARDGAIGRGGAIPWHLPEDMAHFKSATMGHPVIMGRRTWESLPKRPLPGRRNIVVTRNAEYDAAEADVFHSLTEAIAACGAAEIPFVIGGAEIYAAALPFCSQVVMTEVDTEVPDADARFPELDPEVWYVSGKSDHMTSRTGLGYRFITFRRR